MTVLSKGDGPSVPRGIHHVAYRCRDAKETKEFYRDDVLPKNGAILIAKHGCVQRGRVMNLHMNLRAISAVYPN